MIITDQRKLQYIPKFKTSWNPFSNPNVIKLNVNTESFSISTTRNKKPKGTNNKNNTQHNTHTGAHIQSNQRQMPQATDGAKRNSEFQTILKIKVKKIIKGENITYV